MYAPLLIAGLCVGAMCALIALAAYGPALMRKRQLPVRSTAHGETGPPPPPMVSAAVSGETVPDASKATPTHPTDSVIVSAPPAQPATNLNALQPTDTRVSQPTTSAVAKERVVKPSEETLKLPRLEAALPGTLINDLACSVIAGFSPLMQQRKLQMRFDPAFGDPRVDADRYLLERIMFNLMLHAVKSCWEGGEIRLRLHHGDGRLQVSVGDTSEGVTPAAIANEFGTGHPQLTSMHPELDRAGLGLALVKEIAELMNGCIVVRSHSGKGTSVTVDVAAPLVSRGAPQAFAELNNQVEQLQSQLALKEQELKWLARELKIARDYAVSAAQIKSRFLANMSHEIRTPLNGLIATTELILQTELDDEQRELICINREAAFSLLETVNDLLDFSRIEAGNLNLDLISFNLPQLVDGAVDLFSARARHKGIEIDVSVLDDVPPKVLGDPARLRQALINLITNAVKFTDEGTISVEAILQENRGETALVRFSVRDTGIGIEQERLENLFEPFVQGDASMTRKKSGTGLGLSIARRLVELMGGTMGVESEAGKGSHFWFSVPLQVSTQTEGSGSGRVSSENKADMAEPTDNFAPPSPGTAARASIAKRATVLVVEDNLVNQQIARLQLEELGCEVHVVCNGSEAVDALNDRSYDIVLMDCAMPVMDGYEATSRIRAAECRSGKHTKIIAMTAHAMEEDRQRCLACGMDDYLSKPVHAAELRQALHRWLHVAAAQDVT